MNKLKRFIDCLWLKARLMHLNYEIAHLNSKVNSDPALIRIKNKRKSLLESRQI